MGTIRNKNLYDYIVENYIEAKKPMTQQQIADNYGLSIGGVKNFMARHNLNKKGYYSQYKMQIKTYLDKGLKAKEIAKLMNTTPQYVYYITNKEGLK